MRITSLCNLDLYLKELQILVKYAKKLNLSVCLHTNCFSSSNDSVAKSISNMWFEEIIVSFHSHIENDFNYIYNSSNGYAKVSRWINKLISLNNNICINIVCNNINILYLNDILLFIEKEFAWIIAVAISPINPILETNKNILLVSKKVLYQNILEIISSNKDYWFTIHSDLYWIPYCLYYKEELKKKTNKLNFNNGFLYWENIKMKQCWKCKYNNECNWVNKEYLKLYWDEEFIPVL